MAKSTMPAAQRKLTVLLERDPLTAGMSVRIHGEHLILGRTEKVNAGLLTYAGYFCNRGASKCSRKSVPG
jgi:hypothetical protein